MRGVCVNDTLKQAVTLLALAAAVFAVFGLWPGIDLWISGLFFSGEGGFDRFAGGGWNLLRLALWRLSEALLLVSVLAFLGGLVIPVRKLVDGRRLWLFIVALYLLGPGLLVDGVLKPFWGRARPATVAEFGGSLSFTPPHVPAHQCLSNCSFVAGEVAGAVALAASLVLLLDRPLRRISPTPRRMASGMILLIPLYIGFQRIAAGRHFLSDVLLAAILVLLCALVLKLLILRPQRR